jgi:pimeloyl-ACP methyl ester carboxylesterase
MPQANVDGITLKYEERGSGEPVVFIHGALLAGTYRPLMGQSALEGYRVIGYHRRGYAGSTGDAAVPISRQAADCVGLLRSLDAAPAHIVGHSSGGAIAIQIALDNPEVVRSLAVLEPALLDVPSGAALFEMLAPSVAVFDGGDSAGAVDAFLRPVCGANYRASVDCAIPGDWDQAVQDAATFFAGEFPAVGGWALTREDAARINKPVLSVLGADTGQSIGLPVYTEIHERCLEWFPNAKPFVLPNAAHLLQVENPHDMAEGLAAFLANN